MRVSRRIRVVNVLALAVALVVGCFVFSRRATYGEEEAFAAPPVPRRALDDAGVDATPAAPPSIVDAGTDGGDDPIDLAVVGPDGGVPRPRGGTSFKSPFAKPDSVPVRARVGMMLNSVEDYDVKTGTFNADFFFSLTSEAPMPSLNLIFPNGKVESKEILADKPTFKLMRMTGSFRSPPDLRKFPFDQQELKILVEDDSRGIDQLRFQVDHDRTTLARGFRPLGWQVNRVDARSLSQSYRDRFEGDDLYYNRYIFTVGVERYATSAAFKVFVPAFVIVIIALLGMWVPPTEMEVRSNSGAPMLAGAVLFHFALMQELPATAYMTRADKLMLGVYIALALGMISTWWMFLVKEENMHTVFRIARVVVPILTAAVMAAAVLL